MAVWWRPGRVTAQGSVKSSRPWSARSSWGRRGWQECVSAGEAPRRAGQGRRLWARTCPLPPLALPLALPLVPAGLELSQEPIHEAFVDFSSHKASLLGAPVSFPLLFTRQLSSRMDASPLFIHWVLLTHGCGQMPGPPPNTQ